MNTREIRRRFEALIDRINQKFSMIRTELQEFPSGAFMLDVFLDKTLFVLECDSKYLEFGVSQVNKNNPFSGADFVSSNFDEAAQQLLTLLSKNRNS